MSIKKTNIKNIANNDYAKFDLGLLCESKYKKLKPIDKLLYTILLNQHTLSLYTTSNGSSKYVDKYGDIFIRMSQEILCKILDVSKPTLIAALKRLEDIELIEIHRTGIKQSNKMYIGSLDKTLTYGDYMDMLHDEKIKEEKKATINTTNITNLGSKKADSPTKTISHKVKSNSSKAIVYQNGINMQEENDTKVAKKVNNSNESIENTQNSNGKNILELIENSGVSIKDSDLDKCVKRFTDVEKLKKALSECELLRDNGIKALTREYNNIDNKKNKLNEIKNNNNNNNNINNKFKTRFHNINQRTDKYTSKQLEELILNKNKIS